MKELALEITKISKSYDQKNFVFKDLSFKLEKGEKLALVGANGSGKSTLLRSSLKLLPANAEKILLLGEDVTNSTKSELLKVRSKIGFVFQQHNLVPRLSVLTNVIHGSLANSFSPRLWYQSLSPNNIREKALFHLEQVGLCDFASRRASDLSGGQSQRVAVARALMQDPELLVADEPVASLDPKAGFEVMELFKNLCDEEKISFIFVSHHIDHAIYYSDRIIALKKGSIFLNESSDNLKEEDLEVIYA